MWRYLVAVTELKSKYFLLNMVIDLYRDDSHLTASLVTWINKHEGKQYDGSYGIYWV